MAQTVLVANRHAEDARAIVAALGPTYSTQTCSVTGELQGALDSASALVLDTDFSHEQGIDTLMDVLARKHLPVLMITPLDDPACAVEALRCGAASYLVKSGAYQSLIPTAVNEIIQRGSSIVDLKREIVTLRLRVAELEGRTRPDAATPAANAKATAAPTAKPTLLEGIVARMRSGELTLQAYPQVAIKLRQLVANDGSSSEIARTVSQDAAISAKLLHIANSAWYANGRHVDSIEDAISRIGLADTCNLAEIVSNQSLYAARNRAYRPFFDELWVHSVACAHACESLARRIGNNADIARPKLFSLGLLHDVGALVLLQAIANLDPQGERVGGEKDVAALRKFLAAQHVQFGVHLLRRWNFEEDFIEVVRYHDDLDGCKSHNPTLMLVCLANRLVHSRGYGDSATSIADLECAVPTIFFGLEQADLEAVGDEVVRAVEKIRTLLT